MAVSKVVLGNETLIDLTGDSVSSENLLQGETAHGANGEEVIGGVVVTPMYTGTKAAIEEAIALGQIPEDAVVNITDDEETSSFQTQINEINSSLTDLGGFKPVINETTGEITGYKTTIGGADTVFPFSSIDKYTMSGNYSPGYIYPEITISDYDLISIESDEYETLYAGVTLSMVNKDVYNFFIRNNTTAKGSFDINRNNTTNTLWINVSLTNAVITFYKFK